MSMIFKGGGILYRTYCSIEVSNLAQYDKAEHADPRSHFDIDFVRNWRQARNLV